MFPTSFIHKTNNRLGILMLGLMARNRIQKRRKEYIRPIFTRRLVNGEYTILRELESDPFYHKAYFRMTKDSFDYLFKLVETDKSHPIRHSFPIPPKLRLAILLRYLATGCSQMQLAMSYRVSPCSVSKIIREVLNALIRKLQGLYFPTPNHATWTDSEAVFREKWNFPFCVGAIDGKHVRIRCPWQSGSFNFNYKGFFSVVVIAVVSGDYRFLVADIGAPGSESDAAIFTNTDFVKSVERKSFYLPENGQLRDQDVPYVFVGDEAFPLKPWLMRPFPRHQLDLQKRIFNYRLTRAQRVVENAFGIWAARWRILFSAIDGDQDLVHAVITCTIILHNFLRIQCDSELSGDDFGGNGVIIPGNWRNACSQTLRDIPRVGSNNYSMRAQDVREKFTEYFCNDGRLDWQEEYVTRS